MYNEINSRYAFTLKLYVNNEIMSYEHIDHKLTTTENIETHTSLKNFPFFTENTMLIGKRQSPNTNRNIFIASGILFCIIKSLYR